MKEKDKDEIINILNEMIKIFWHGCTNHGCEFNDHPQGMKTNMICKCRMRLRHRAENLINILN